MLEECKELEEYENSVTKVLLEKDEETIKNILWCLSYDPVQTLKDWEFESDEEELKKLAKKIRRKILYEYKKAHSDFYFADELTKLNNYGVELKIEDPIVRDTIIERCEKVSEDSKILRFCIVYFCTRKESIEYDERRTAAFDTLGFDVSEKEFIESTFDTYCIGELLKAIQNVKYPLPNPKIYKNKINFEAYGEKERYALELIKNKDKILMLFENMKSISTEEIRLTLVSGLDKNSSAIISLSEELRNQGLDSKEIYLKQEEILNFFDTIEEL